MRLLLAASAFAAIAAPAAAKPGVEAVDAGPREQYRAAGIAICARELAPAAGDNAEDNEAVCGCAADRFMAGRQLSALPAVDQSGMPPAMRPDLLQCIAEMRPAGADALVAQAMRPPAAIAPDKPADAAPSGPGLRARFGGLLARLDRTGIPRWAWAPLVVLGLVLLRLLFRRGERDDNLLGPPRPAHYRNLPRR